MRICRFRRDLRRLAARRCTRLKELVCAARDRIFREARVIAGFIAGFFVVFWLLLCIARHSTAVHYSSWSAVLDSMQVRGAK